MNILKGKCHTNVTFFYGNKGICIIWSSMELRRLVLFFVVPSISDFSNITIVQICFEIIETFTNIEETVCK